MPAWHAHARPTAHPRPHARPVTQGLGAAASRAQGKLRAILGPPACPLRPPSLARPVPAAEASTRAAQTQGRARSVRACPGNKLVPLRKGPEAMTVLSLNRHARPLTLYEKKSASPCHSPLCTGQAGSQHPQVPQAPQAPRVCVYVCV